MRLRPFSKTETPSGLAVDLAVSRVALAALKAKAQIAPTEEECSSAALLQEVFLKDLGISQGAREIPVSIGPVSGMQRDLEEVLRTLAPIGNRSQRAKPELMEKLVPLLGALANHVTLAPDAAGDLAAGLMEIESAGG